MAKMTCTRPEWSNADKDPCPCDYDDIEIYGDCDDCSYYKPTDD